MPYLANESWVTAIRSLTRNGSDCVQTASAFVPDRIQDTSFRIWWISLASLAGSIFKDAQWNRAYSISHIPELKYTSQKADLMGELSPQTVRSTTESTFLKHKIPLSFLLKNIYSSFPKLCFSLAFFRYWCQCHFTSFWLRTQHI